METVLKLGVDSTAAKAGADAAKSSLKEVEQQAKSTTTALEALQTTLKLLAGSWAVLKLAEYVKDAALLNSRFETMGVVMTTVGRNAGYTANEMRNVAGEVQKMGITMLEARDSVTKFVQAGLDLTKAAPLARVAQDAAVIANMNSSEAFATIVHGIQSGNSMILHNIGLSVQWEDGYKKMAKTLGVNAAQLTEHEKMQARLNETMSKGVNIASVYEAAMDTAGKQLNSLKRYSEDSKTMLGEVFNETLTAAVYAWTDHLKNGNKEMKELAQNDALKKWGEEMVDIFALLGDQVFKVWNGLKFVAASAEFGAEKVNNWLERRKGGQNQALNKIYDERDNRASDKYFASIETLRALDSNPMSSMVQRLREQRQVTGARTALNDQEDSRDAAMADALGVARHKKSGARGPTDAQIKKAQEFMDRLNETVLEKVMASSGDSPIQVEVQKLTANAKRAGVGAGSIRGQLNAIAGAQATTENRKAENAELIRQTEETEARYIAAGQAMKGYTEAVRDFDREQEFQATLLGKSAAEQQLLTAQRQIDNQAMKANSASLGEYSERISRLAETMKTKLGDAYKTAKEKASDWMTGANNAIRTYSEMVDDVAKQTESAFTKAFSSAEDTMTQFLRTGKLDFKSFIDVVINEFLRIEMVRPLLSEISGMLSKMMKQVRESVGAGGGGGGLLGLLGFGRGGDSDFASAAGSVGGVDGWFADGGVMTPMGPMPLRKFAGGGIARGPTAAIYGEGDKSEAIIPLPDGRSVPVTMKGGAGTSVVVNVYEGHGTKTEVSQQQQPDGTTLINIISAVVNADVRSNGQISQTMAGIYGLRRQAAV